MAHAMRKIALAALASLMLALPTGAAASGPWDNLLAPESACPGQDDPSASAEAQEQIMLCMHNYARAASGLSPLRSVKPLRVSSDHKAKDLRSCDQFSHEACGRNIFFWLRKVGFMRGTYGVGENLAWGTGPLGTVHTIMSNWLNSDAHRTILLTPSYQDVGISLAQGRFRGFNGAEIWVAHFGYHR
jgi:uncharacterized protein YkwD